MTALIPTIYAPATPPGRSGVAVVRVSGPGSAAGLAALTAIPLPEARRASLRTVLHPVSRDVIDHAVVILFKGPSSFTGEDSVEYHLHGGKAVIDALLSALAALPGYRLAEPGEFTRRAFENGRMDLTGAEAVADLINAETALQREQALQQMGGALADLYQGWTDRLASILAHLEADIDFPDEDLPDGIADTMRPLLHDLKHELETHLNDNRRGERLRDGLKLAIIGAPNAGKSSLINALARKDVAIVSDTPGTTRDVIEVHLDINGYPVTIADTAGLRPGQGQGNASGHDAIENEGIRRALARAREADLLLLLFDAAIYPAMDQATKDLAAKNALIVFNKSDLNPNISRENGLSISARTGQGLDDLIAALMHKISESLGQKTAMPLTRARHRAALEEGLSAMNRALDASLPELMTEDLRLSLRAFGRITGRVDVEDLLDIIFRDFCIGK